jgi:SPP1 gp7 family putative phage head morphogenesis protein
LIQLLLMPDEDALAYWRSKVALSADQYRQLNEEMKARAFTVSGVTCARAVGEIFGLIDQALQSGMTPKQFVEASKTLLARRGFVDVEPFQLQNVFVTNMQSAYQAGRFKQMLDPAVLEDRPYWKYTAMHDKRTRPSHRALDNTVRRYDDPFWKTHYPPNGFRCRCGVQNLTAEEVASEGLEVGEGPVIDPATGQAIQPDEGFRNNPAAATWKPDLTGLDSALRKVFEEKFHAAD